MEQRIRLLIADDRQRSRDRLWALLATCPKVEVVGEAATLSPPPRPTIPQTD